MISFDKIKYKIKYNKKIYPFLYAFLCLFSSDDADKLLGIRQNKNEILIRHNGNEHKGQILYHLCMNDSDGGFFALMKWTCIALLFADNRGFIPYVEYGHDCKYYDCEISVCDNPFEYYFSPVSVITKRDISQAYNVVNYEKKHLLERRGDLMYSRQQAPETISEFARIWNKYIHINDAMLDELEKDKSAAFSHNEKKTLAVHYRGTDYKANYKKHPVAITLEEEIGEVRRAIKEKGFDRIFLASDEEDAVKRFKEEFGDAVICYFDTMRSSDGRAVHDTTHNRKNDRFLLGYEVLRDVWTMSQCDGLIAGVSNVSFFAMIMNEASSKKYEFCYIIDHGKNMGGKIYSHPKKQ